MTKGNQKKLEVPTYHIFLAYQYLSMAYVYTGIFHQNGRPEKLYFWGQVIGVTHPQKRPWLDPYGLQYHGQSLLQVMSTKKTFAGDLVGGIAYLPL